MPVMRSTDACPIGEIVESSIVGRQAFAETHFYSTSYYFLRYFVRASSVYAFEPSLGTRLLEGTYGTSLARHLLGAYGVWKLQYLSAKG